MKNLLLLALLLIGYTSQAQVTDPIVTSWIQNTTGATGYNGIVSNVQKVQYSADSVYVSASCIPGYDIGPWNGNPNIPVNENFQYRLTRHPVQNTGAATATSLGHIGVWCNGVSIFNAKDARSYNNAGYWNQNAILVEGSSFDTCNGHPAPNGEYHLHLNPKCLYNDRDSSKHSPILGFAFDGFPIYGAFAYSNTNGTGTIRHMVSSYRLRSITTRDTLPNGTVLSAGNYGPAIATPYVLGYYIEDFEYISGMGDLDEHNGRFCVTPEYPSGTYAYFMSIDSVGNSVYPYTLGLTYYGVVTSGNTGPGSGHNTPGVTVTTYTAPTGIAENNLPAINTTIYPVPAHDQLTVQFNTGLQKNAHVTVSNNLGQVLQQADVAVASTNFNINTGNLSNGVYWLHIDFNDGNQYHKAFVKE